MIFQRDDDREGYQELYKRKGRSLLMKICLPGDGDEGSGREHAEWKERGKIECMYKHFKNLHPFYRPDSIASV